MPNKSTTELQQGDLVFTTPVTGEDFGLPLVEPTHSVVPSRRVIRAVRNHVRARGGTVVWFDDGTKSRPVHGRTAWVVAS